jgi:transcriptional regulator with XRE-family HTH domain
MENKETEWTFVESLKQYENDPEFVAEGLAMEFVEQMLECMERKGVSQSGLAEKMGVSRAYISRILDARPNMTLLTMAKISIALGLKPDVCLDAEKWKQRAPVTGRPKAAVQKGKPSVSPKSPSTEDLYQYPVKRKTQPGRKDVLVVREKAGKPKYATAKRKL